MTLSCSSPLSVSSRPLSESDPDKFWGEIVQSVRIGHNADGQQFVTASWPGRVAAFFLDDVREYVEKYFELGGGYDESVQSNATTNSTTNSTTTSPPTGAT